MIRVSRFAFVSSLVCLALQARGQGSGSSAGTWPFVYPGDAKPGAVLDLRYLNEKVAGETGFVRLSADRRGFVRGDGKPIRFWPVNAYGYRLKPEEMTANARFLAKMGVNMVRLHGSISPKGKGKAITDVDTEEIDKIWRYVAALKKEGIYVVVSPFWANGGHAGAAASWGLGYGDGEDIWGLMFFDERLRNAYKGWVQKLYAETNPYTGVPLAKDPAIAIAQVKNEDSLLFWTFQGIKPAQKKVLAGYFAKWLTKKYGSFDAAKAKWDGANQAGDDWAAGVPALLDTWVLTQPQQGGLKARADDQTAFLVDHQKAFYADIGSFYKNTLGYKGLVNANNWITADPVRMNDLERYTYTANDVLAVNRYYNGGVHKGPFDGWRIDEGDFFSDVSALLDPRNLPVNVKQTVGHPTLVTESGWVHPLGYQAEGPLLAAAYQSLSGVGGLFWFALGAKDYETNMSFDFVTFPDGSHPMKKWDESVPQIVGQFPAAALMYRMGYLRQGTPVVHEERTRASLNAREVPVIAEDPSFDPNHAGGDSRAGSAQAKGANPLAFLVGPVEVKYNGDPSKTVVRDVSPFIVGKKVKSVTGELTLDYGKGLLTVDAPKAQAVGGFFKAAGGSFKTKDLTLTSRDEYATVTVVAMDDRPLSTSKKLLVQIGAVIRPTDWKQEPTTRKSDDGKSTLTGFKVVNSGKMPWQVRRTSITLSVRNAGLRKATVLDAAGHSVRTVVGKRSGGAFTLVLPGDAMYVVLGG